MENSRFNHHLRMTPCLLSRSLHLQLNHHRHHARIWGDDDWPRLFMLHGWMDHSATFQFLAEAFTRRYQIIAPDWRGFGGSDWNSGSYYSPDYLADLDALLAQARARGSTLIASLHAVELALDRFPRIIGLREGRVQFDCPATAVTPAMLAELYAGEQEALPCIG